MGGATGCTLDVPENCLASCADIKASDSSSASGLYSICPNGEDSSKISVYCDQTTDGGGWMLLLTQDHATGQYDGSVNPLTQNLNADTPSTTSQYSRDWSTTEIPSPAGGSEFLIKRGTSGNWVRFVQGVDKNFCGFGHQTTDCNNGNEDIGHGYYTEGQAYDESGTLLAGIIYFNGCNYGGGCASSGVDGIGFGSNKNHLLGNYGQTGYGATAWPGELRWGQDAVDTGSNIPYTYWLRVKPCLASCLDIKASDSSSASGLYSI